MNKKVILCFFIILAMVALSNCSCDNNNEEGTINDNAICDTSFIQIDNDADIIVNILQSVSNIGSHSEIQLDTEHFSEDTDDILLNYFKYNIPESLVRSDRKLKSIEFNGKTVSLEYVESRYRNGVDNSQSTMFDEYDVYKNPDGEIYYIRSDGKILYYTNYGYAEKVANIDESKAKINGDKYLTAILGNDAEKYTYENTVNVGLTYAVCYSKMCGGLKTTDTVTMFFNSNDEFVSFSASDRNRYDEISISSSEEIISSCNERLAIVFDNDNDNDSLEYEFSDYIIGECNGKLYLFTDTENKIYFFIPLK